MKTIWNRIGLKHCILYGITVLLLGLTLSSFSEDRKQTEKKKTQPSRSSLLLERIIDSSVPNLINISEGLYSGGSPESEKDFAYLSKLGIKTIVSVDGNKPLLDQAKKFGIKYVHIPIGYDGIAEKESLAMVRVVKEYPKPFYFHCHHGKHRGPAAAAIACQVMTGISTDQAERILEEAHTSKNYAGLWRDVKKFKMPDQDRKLPELHEVAVLDSMTEVMAKISHRFEELQEQLAEIESEKSKTSEQQKKRIQTAQELSLLLAEDFRETNRNLISDYDEEFGKLMKQSEKEATELHESFKTGRLNQSGKLILSLKKSCNQCHQAYRN